ncbi:hypothetical protein MHU86_21910 [Fragilaria crotonensis]|nr:hypothetical protein MHU86_21910 [Fragilaria crotonensis]
MTIPPAKLKAYLGKVKEDILDSSSDFDASFKALVLLELVQRGILPAASPQDDVVTIVAAIRSSAGRALLEEIALPKPLLAGSSAMAGMVAEKCASLLDRQTATSLEGLTEAEHRCREVDDQRLLALLQLPINDSNSQRTQLLHIAEGFFLRAASFQPNQPQMWKKALDVVVARSMSEHQVPLEASFPLANLIRIAESKDNSKRVAELSLHLTESWLSMLADDNSPASKEFVASFRPKLRTSPEAARRCFKKCDISFLDPDGELWYKILALRIEIEDENASIDEAALHTQTAASNRGISSSLSSCKAAARRDYLLSTVDNDPMASYAAELRDAVMNKLEDVSTIKLESARSLFTAYVERLRQRSQAAGVESSKTKPTCSKEQAFKSWISLCNVVQPVLKRLADFVHWSESTDSSKESVRTVLKNSDLSQIDMVKTCALAMANCLWMTCGGEDDVLPADELEFLYFLLCQLHDIVSVDCEKLKQEMVRNSVLQASSDEDKNSKLSLECAFVSARALITMKGNRTPNQDLTEQALFFTFDREKYAPYVGQFGTSFLVFLNVWSGFVHTPWSCCNVSQARAVVKMARVSLNQAVTDWGREPSALENLILDLGEADAEGGFLAGGIGQVAKKLYNTTLEQASRLSSADHVHLVRAHCLAGLSRYTLAGSPGQDFSLEFPKSVAALSEEFARMSLQEAEEINPIGPNGLYLATSGSLDSTQAFHKSLARQLVADSLLRAGASKDAEAFLEAAVQDTPQDFDSALALGAFRMRTAFFPATGQSPSSDKAAQTQLLKAAKLNPSKASPFALLGFWYEEKRDFQRALGCYSKALVQEPSHPVAGRGILRLQSYIGSTRICDSAVNTKSPMNGWAWRAIGSHKAVVDADNDAAVICFQEALRCRDIAFAENETMSLFYKQSSNTKAAFEIVEVWSDLAGCYRRLGRLTAAIRAFEAAWSISGKNLPPDVLTSWAQVQLELGLVKDSAEKFSLALEKRDKAVLPIASYGLGCALLALAQRDLRDGKASFAHQNLMKAVAVAKDALVQDDQLRSNFLCLMKLLGDMHTFAAQLPAHVFGDDINADNDPFKRTMSNLRSQISFIAVGEKYYLRGEEEANRNDEGDSQILRSAFACDAGTNILLQAQRLSVLRGEGQGTAPNLSLSETILFEDVRSAFDRSADAFKRSISLNPLFAPAWCGIGCAVIGSDPLLAQHCLVCAIQLDKALPDALANLAFLYAGHNADKPALCVMDELTQVADTPMMWICRASMLERQALLKLNDTSRALALSQAADAFRAAVQVTKEPTALLGIGLTCRASGSEDSKLESVGYMSEFLGATSSQCVGAFVLHAAMTVEMSIQTSGFNPSGWKDEVIRNALTSIEQFLVQAERTFVAPSLPSELVVESKRGEIITELIDGLSHQFNKDPEEILHPRSQNLQVQIITDPSNGKLWLALAKGLAKELSKVKGDKRRKVVLHAIESATFASERAARILFKRVTAPVGCSGVVHAQDVADAFALSFWVKNSQKELMAEMKKPLELSPANGYDLQRAIMMDPNCRLAREALSNSGS